MQKSKRRKRQLTYRGVLAEIAERIAKSNQNQVAVKYGLTKQNVNQLMSGRIALSDAMALRLGFRVHIHYTRCRPVAMKLKRGRQPRVKVAA
jgi:hypothetical protein